MSYTKTITLTDGAGKVVYRQEQVDLATFSPQTRGRKAAMDQQCKDCICDTYAPGNWRDQVTLCTSFDCSLWDLRPVSSTPMSDAAKGLLPSHLLDDEWCADPANFRTRPYVGSEKTRIDALVEKKLINP